MKNKFVLALGVALLAVSVANAADENSNSATAAAPPVNVVQTVQAQTSSESKASNGPIYIIEKQPTTVVEDTQLKDSKSDQLRKAREEVERQTEEKIVEHLENDRVKAEQDRAKRVMGAFEGKLEQKVEPVKEVVVPVQAPAVVAPPPAIIEVREELKKEDQDSEKKNPVMVSPKAGFASYPSAANMAGGFGAGLSVGKVFDSAWIFELGFLYSKFDIEIPQAYYGNPYTYLPGNLYIPLISELEQFNYTAEMKYLLFNDTRISPYIGGLMSYTYRSYSMDDRGTNWVYWNDPVSSGALDVGLSAGVSVEMSKNFRVGADVRYYWNLTYDVESKYQRSMLFPSSLADTEVERLSYYQFLLSGQLLF